jgi:hypothetical protein
VGEGIHTQIKEAVLQDLVGEVLLKGDHLFLPIHPGAVVAMIMWVVEEAMIKAVVDQEDCLQDRRLEGKGLAYLVGRGRRGFELNLQRRRPLRTFVSA